MLTTLPIQEKIAQIIAIDHQLSALSEQIDTAKIETRKLIEKRDKLNEEFKKLRKEVRELKSERDNLNEKVQDLKMLRDETRSKTHVLIEELRATKQKIRDLIEKTPKRSSVDLQEELDGIEWTIQTTSLELEEEKKLVENVKQLETQLSVYKKIKRKRQETVNLKTSLETLDSEAEAFHKELQGIVQKSQELHSKMMAKIAESKKVKAEADGLHTAYIQAKEKTSPANQQFRELVEQKKFLQGQLKKEEESKQKGKQIKLKEMIVEEAREKLQKGEKLSWNEFQLLSENDAETEN